MKMDFSLVFITIFIACPLLLICFHIHCLPCAFSLVFITVFIAFHSFLLPYSLLALLFSLYSYSLFALCLFISFHYCIHCLPSDFHYIHCLPFNFHYCIHCLPCTFSVVFITTFITCHLFSLLYSLLALSEGQGELVGTSTVPIPVPTCGIIQNGY